MPAVKINQRALIRVTGAEAEHFLHNLVTADIEGLKAGGLSRGRIADAARENPV